MRKAHKISDGNNEPLIAILKSQVIPCWEHFGMERMAITANNLKQFQAQGLPAAMRTDVKRRIGRKAPPRSRKLFNNSNIYVEKWPDDDQAIFRYPALVFVLSGEAQFHVADYLIHCPNWHFLLFAPSVPRPSERIFLCLTVDNNVMCCGFLLHREQAASLLMFVIVIMNVIGMILIESCSDPEAVQFFHFLVSDMAENASQHSPIIHPGFLTFLHLFLREIEAGRYHSIGKGETKNIDRHIDSPIEQAQQYIKLHLNKPLTASQVATQVYMSRTVFLQRFSRETGETFHVYLTRWRMETAKELLEKGYWSTIYICESIGLRPTQFRTQFKRYFGITPTQHRDAHRKANDSVAR